MNEYRSPLLTPYRGYLVAAALLFVAGILLGVIAALYYPEIIQQALALLEEPLQRIGEEVFQGEIGQGILLLFLHNLRTLALVGLLGLILGIYPTLAMLLNGLVIGVVGAITSENISLAAFLAGIIPHGIVEIPAIIIAGAVGLRLGLAPIFKRKSSPFAAPNANTWQGYGQELIMAFRLFLLCAALLLVAAGIEVAITPRIMALFLN